MRKRQTHWLFMTTFFLIAIACTPLMSEDNAPGGTLPATESPLALATDTPATADASSDAATMGEELTFYIAPEMVDCVGVAPMHCLQVKYERAGEYELFYDKINGFDFVPGYAYELRVQRRERENPPADASRYTYALVEVISQTPVAIQSELPLVGTQWGLVAFGAADSVLYQPENALITANFENGLISGNAGCNQYSAGIETVGDLTAGTITVAEVAATRMLCPEPVMGAENAYFSALAAATNYQIDGEQLTITYPAGAMVLLATTANVDDTSMTATTVCRFAGTGATLAFDDKRVNFTCGTPEQVLLGTIDPGPAGWQIEEAMLTRTAGNFTIGDSRQAMILQIELVDGTRCDWSGGGATIAFDGKRANFTCEAENVVLLGEVEQGADGWLIEKATLTHGDNGFSIVSAEPTLIAALSVQ